MQLRVSEIISQLLQVMLAKCVLSVLELNWDIGKQIACRQVLTSSTKKLMSFPVVERTRTAMKCTKMEKACVRAKRGKLQFAIVKYANLSSLVPCFRSFQFRETYIAQLISNGTSYRQKCLLTKLFFDSLNNHLSNGMLTRDGVNI